MSELPVEQRHRDAMAKYWPTTWGIESHPNDWSNNHPVLQAIARFERDNNLVPAPQWQPIGTAPRDGTRFLAMDAVSGEVGCLSIILTASINDDDPEVIYSDHGFQRATLTPEPTHWMPLPTLPNMEDSHES